MRVLHVLSRLNYSGAERMLSCSYAHWKAVGIEPIIVGMADGDHPFGTVLEEQGYRVIELPPVRSVRGLSAFRKALKDVRPDVVHIHQESCFDAIALLAASSPDVGAVVRTAHSCFRFSGTLRVRRAARAAFSRRLGVTWVACSQEVADTESSRFRNTTRVVENWVDIDSIKTEATHDAGSLVRHELGIEPDMPVLGLIGNCDAAKNHELVPEALERVALPVHVLHVGNAARASLAERQSWRTLPERHSADHLGTYHRIYALLAACDLVLVPSLREGLPLVAIESLCAGVPVLAADAPGLGWLSDMPAAALVPHGTAFWGGAIEAALSRDWSAETAATVAIVRSRFDPRSRVRDYVSVYNEALGPRRFARRLRGRRQAEVIHEQGSTGVRPHTQTAEDG
jgi:glycosyltransferase involved in cell wall biosynthesis